MHLSTRGRYAVMAMIDLAVLQTQHQQEDNAKPVTLAEIAERQNLSLSYLEQLFAKLRRSGLVSSVRGPGGGYMLQASENETWLGDIIAAVDEDIDLTRCGGCGGEAGDENNRGCVKGSRCNAHNIWVALSRHMMGFLASVSVGMVLRGEFDLDGALPQGAKVSISA